MNGLLADLGDVRERFNAALEQLKAHESTDAENMAAIGYCMGGGIVLHMARYGADLKAVASFHGALPLGVAPEGSQRSASVALATYQQARAVEEHPDVATTMPLFFAWMATVFLAPLQWCYEPTVRAMLLSPSFVFASGCAMSILRVQLLLARVDEQDTHVRREDHPVGPQRAVVFDAVLHPRLTA